MHHSFFHMTSECADWERLETKAHRDVFSLAYNALSLGMEASECYQVLEVLSSGHK
jgi:hypothetical protein